jgi:broad specificity phosphatase PhoE
VSAPELWLIRHGQTEWSRDSRHTGRTDVPLTPAGEAAATELGAKLKDVRFDLVLVSPRARARRTADLAGLRAEVEPRAVEWDYGEYEGLTRGEIRETRPGWTVWRDGVVGGETLGQVAERADAVIARARAEGDAGRERVLLVAHGHFSRVLAMRWIGAAPQLAEHFPLETAAVGVLGWDRGIPVIERWNA